MSEEAKKEITVKIKLPVGKVIEVKISPDATFKKFLEAAIEQNHELKDFGYVKFEHRCNIWNTEENWANEQGWLKRKQTLVFNKATLAKQFAANIRGNVETEKVPMGINSHLFIKDGDELSLVLAADDPCAINLNNLDETKSRQEKIPNGKIIEFKSKCLPRPRTKQDVSQEIDIDDLQVNADNEDNQPAKINWPRIIIGVAVLLLLIFTIILFLLFFLSSLNIPLTAPIVCAVVSVVAFVFWVAWNNIVSKDWQGGIIYKPLSEDSNDFIKENGFENSQPKYKNTSDLDLKETDN